MTSSPNLHNWPCACNCDGRCRNNVVGETKSGISQQRLPACAIHLQSGLEGVNISCSDCCVGCIDSTNQSLALMYMTLGQEHSARRRLIQEQSARRRLIQEQSARRRLIQEQSARRRLIQEQSARRRLIQEQSARRRLIQEQSARRRLIQEQSARRRLIQEQSARRRLIQEECVTPLSDLRL
ncbi:uncharacterized protein ACWYII_037914 isoform 1-T1 [Salvelinus alpinus]